MKNTLTIDRKLNLTIEEAAAYSNIGENKIRELIREPGVDFVLFIGRKILIKRKQFEQYLEEKVSI